MQSRANAKQRPNSPNMQIYRPQLTSVLSIANRASGIVLSLGAVGLVFWLVAAANGPEAYAYTQLLLASSPGQIGLLLFVFAFFFHLCGGLRHHAWDAGLGFDLAAIYRSGWAVVAASALLTALSWLVSLVMRS